MKKSFILFILICLLTGCSQKSSTLTTSGITTISYKTLSSYLKQNTTFMLYIGRDDCSDCYTLSQMISDYTKDTNTGVFYLNLKDYESFVDEKVYNKTVQKLKAEALPVLEVIKNGKILKHYVYLDESYYKIEDRKKQIEEREKYKKKFVSFMNDYFEVDYEMS